MGSARRLARRSRSSGRTRTHPCTGARSPTPWPTCRTTQREELAWDLRSLDAVADVTDEGGRGRDDGTAGAMRPSLHLNLGEDYRKLGELAAARRHLELGRAAATPFPTTGTGG